ncbi:MAG: tyrosine-type recombinase/integrase [Methanosarcinaceae archaeon]
MVWNKLKEFAGDSVNSFEYSPNFIRQFMLDSLDFGSKSKSKNQCRRDIRALNILYNYLHFSRVSWRKPQLIPAFSELSAKVFTKYLRHIAANLARSTIDSKMLFLERFDSFLVQHNIRSFSELTPALFIDFFKSLPSARSASRVRDAASTLRGLFRYMYENHIIESDFSVHVPYIRKRTNITVPNTYTKEEIITLLNSIDRGNSRGKRDYAMLQLFCRLGLRTADLTGLKFENLKWEDGILEFHQQKTGKKIILPLLNEVGNAIIDYLKHGRPKLDSPFVFLRAAVPLHRLENSGVYNIVHKRLKEAGIKIPPSKQSGGHSLRHSLASILLANGTTLPVISESLGHVDTQTTMHYLKIDIKQLRACSLDMPVILDMLNKENKNA